MGRLRVVDADAVSPLGNGQWLNGGTRLGRGVQILQGSLEKSNADPIRGMLELVEASRYFEAYQKTMQTSDELDSRSNELMRKSR